MCLPPSGFSIAADMMRPSHRKKLVNALKELEGGAKDLRVVLVVGGGGGGKKTVGIKEKEARLQGLRKMKRGESLRAGMGRVGLVTDLPEPKLELIQ